MQTNEFVIRTLTQRAEIDPIEQLQEDIWGYGKAPEAPFPYPGRCLFEFAESGGHVAGAYSHAGELIGFSAAWLGREKSGSKRLYLHSQLVGIKAAWRNAGIGQALKLHQLNSAIAEKLTLIKWTFDPLQSRNAYLNLHKLGGIVCVFIQDYYGDLAGTQNQGFPTDRFWVEWHVASPRVQSRVEKPIGKQPMPEGRLVNQAEGPAGRRRCIFVANGCKDSQLLVEIPPNITEMRNKMPDLAMEWHLAFRKIFVEYLQQYTISDCVVEDGRPFYVLSRRELGSILQQ